MWQYVCTGLELLRIRGGEILAVLDRLEDLLELVADVDGNDGWRCFICAQAVIIARGCDGYTHQICILIHCTDDTHKEEQELNVLTRRLARIEQVLTLGGDHGPVVVLTGAVDALERLLMQEACIIMLVGDLLHHLHRELVVVDGNVGGLKDRCQLVL